MCRRGQELYVYTSPALFYCPLLENGFHSCYILFQFLNPWVLHESGVYKNSFYISKERPCRIVYFLFYTVMHNSRSLYFRSSYALQLLYAHQIGLTLSPILKCAPQRKISRRMDNPY